MRIKRTGLDSLYTRYIFIRDGWTCQRCKTSYKGKPGLNASHFFGRSHHSTRYDDDNVKALCMGCHLYFSKNPMFYVDFMMERIGAKALQKLVQRFYLAKPFDPKGMKLWLKNWLKKNEARGF